MKSLHVKNEMILYGMVLSIVKKARQKQEREKKIRHRLTSKGLKALE
jgi:hypothetical protein